MIVAIYVRRFLKHFINFVIFLLSNLIKLIKLVKLILFKLYLKIISQPNEGVTILFIGLPSSGKSSILYYIKLNQYVFISSSGPIEEYTTFPLKHNKFVNLRLLEIGKSESLATSREYLSKSPNVVFVIDSLDVYGLEEARRNVFDNLYEHLNIHKDPRYLFLLSKQDIRGGLNVKDLENFLNIPQDIFDKCHISGCSALRGTGIIESVRWIVTGNKICPIPVKPKDYLIQF